MLSLIVVATIGCEKSSPESVSAKASGASSPESVGDSDATGVVLTPVQLRELEAKALAGDGSAAARLRAHFFALDDQSMSAFWFEIAVENRNSEAIFEKATRLMVDERSWKNCLRAKYLFALAFSLDRTMLQKSGFTDASFDKYVEPCEIVIQQGQDAHFSR